MENKIAWYKEMLAHEPLSKLFYPLARLYWEADQVDKAIAVLDDGLRHHPEHFPARLFLAQCYCQQGLDDEAIKALEPVFNHLEQSQCLWSLWAKKQAREQRDTAATMLDLTGMVLKEKVANLEAVIQAGLNSQGQIQEKAESRQDQDQRQTPAEPGLSTDKGPGLEGGDQPPGQAFFAESGASSSKTLAAGDEGAEKTLQPSLVRTKAMADIMAEQGERREAAAIYKQLLDQTQDAAEKKDLTQRLSALGKTGKEGQDQDKDERLLNTLQGLAERLEARG